MKKRNRLLVNKVEEAGRANICSFQPNKDLLSWAQAGPCAVNTDCKLRLGSELSGVEWAEGQRPGRVKLEQMFQAEQEPRPGGEGCVAGSRAEGQGWHKAGVSTGKDGGTVAWALEVSSLLCLLCAV